MFIALEGADGAGTTTQQSLLAERIRKEFAVRVCETEEPVRGLLTGQLIRKMLSGEYKADPHALMLLFAADRIEHCRQIIYPARIQGMWVLTDRYLLSSMVYQSNDECLMCDVETLNCKAIPADLYLVLDVPVDVAMRRIGVRDGKREIFENFEKLRDVCEKYHSVGMGRWHFASGIEKRVVLVDGTMPTKDVTDACMKVIHERC